MTSPDIPARPVRGRRAAIGRQIAGFAVAALAAYVCTRAWPAHRWPGRDVVALCTAIVAGNVALHALTPPPRPRWLARVAEICLMAIGAGLIFSWLMRTWP